MKKSELRVIVILASLAVAQVAAGAQAPANGASSSKAKEVAALMAAKKLETFAARDPQTPKGYVAVLTVPNVQLLLVAATYSRDSDIEYWLFRKEYQNAYLDLRSGIYGADRFFVDDAQADGLVAVPGKNPMHDAVKVDTAKHVFDGLFGDGKGRSAKYPLQDAYMKAFTDADARYARLLDIIIAQLKAMSPVAPVPAMR